MGRSKWLIKIFGYLLYSLAILALMLWLQFPDVAVKNRLEYELRGLTPGLEWNIGNISLALPAAICFTDIKVSDNRRLKEPLVIIDSLALRPALQGYLEDRKLSVEYRMDILEGSIAGRLSLTDDHNGIVYNANVHEVKFTDLKEKIQELGRTVSGTLSGNFNGKGVVRGSGRGELSGNFTLLQGEISFRKPVLGMAKLDFSQVSSQLTYGADGVSIVDGKVESRLLAADFSGMVIPAENIGLSRLQLNGTLIPRPEFLSAISVGTDVSKVMKQLQGEKMPFVISGTLKEPAVAFNGQPTGLDQRSPRKRK